MPLHSGGSEGSRQRSRLGPCWSDGQIRRQRGAEAVTRSTPRAAGTRSGLQLGEKGHLSLGGRIFLSIKSQIARLVFASWCVQAGMDLLGTKGPWRVSPTRVEVRWKEPQSWLMATHFTPKGGGEKIPPPQFALWSLAKEGVGVGREGGKAGCHCSLWPIALMAAWGTAAGWSWLGLLQKICFGTRGKGLWQRTYLLENASASHFRRANQSGMDKPARTIPWCQF